MNDYTPENDQPKRPRGRPRKHPQGEKPPKKPLTAAQRSEQGRASWAKRSPTYTPQKCITVRGDVFDELTKLRGEKTWTVYLCELAGLSVPIDRRCNRNT